MKPITENYYSKYAIHWGLDSSIMFLNHGSFGATPKIVLDYQNLLIRQMEAEPIRFFVREAHELWFNAKKKIAPLLGMQEKNFTFIRNATEAVSNVLYSFNWQGNEHIVYTNHIYPACRNAIQHYAKRFNFSFTEVTIPYPIHSEDEIVERVVSAIQPNTKLLLIDHITSPTAIIFPVKKIVDSLKHTDVKILVDGAHAPCSIPLNVEELGVHYYTGNLHKWMCTPKSAAIFWVAPELQEDMHPLIISKLNLPSEEFADRYFWLGTLDLSAIFSIPAAIDFLDSLFESGIDELMRRNHSLLLEARKIICDTLEIEEPCPAEMNASMCSMPIPSIKITKYNTKYIDPVQDVLYHEHKIEVPVFNWPDENHKILRISCQAYNSIEQYVYLAEALKKILRK